MMDDDHLLYRGDDMRDATLTQMKELGVDVVRVTVLWSVDRQQGAPRRQGAGSASSKLGADNPKAYPCSTGTATTASSAPARRWGSAATSTSPGPGPRGATSKAPASTATDREDLEAQAARVLPVRHRRSASATAASTSDENDGRKLLPRINFWSLWNEPNQGGWLTPAVGRRPDGVSPAALPRAVLPAASALQSTGHGRDVILVGETAPIGVDRQDSRAPIRPRPFIREMFCLDANNVPYTGAQARARKCSNIAEVRADPGDGVGSPPLHQEGRARPTATRTRDVITMANIEDLGTGSWTASAANSGLHPPGHADRLQRVRLRDQPPDPYQGISLETQANWMNLGDLVAFNNPRVIGQTQFLLRDVGPRGATSPGPRPTGRPTSRASS